jgi:UDP-N-acetylglucosamine--N-acetylmuramyl-(pentapeptide) pyrophosphoryl-undecaprenol N-acetylglucosamine transferase
VKPAILIPIPWAEGNEQEKNARVLLDLGMAEILPQKELSGEILRKKIEEMLADIDAYRRRGREGKKLVRVGAAKEITEEIEKLVREKQ